MIQGTSRTFNSMKLRSGVLGAMGLALALAAIAPQPAGAQQAPTPPADSPPAAPAQNSAATPPKDGAVALPAQQIVGVAAAPVVAAQQSLDEVAGGVSLVNTDDVDQQHLSGVADLLAYQPGVYIEGAGSTGGPKISIRGSAINQGHLVFRHGIQYNFDGLPLTGPEGTPYEQWDPFDVAYTQVYKGANGLELGGIQSGGAIDFVSHTGYDAYLYQGRIDFGSFGYFNTQVSSGRVVGKADYYVSLDAFTDQGFPENTESKGVHLTGNFGYKFNDNVDNRIYVRYTWQREQDIGGITRAQIDADPTVAPATAIFDHQHRFEPGSVWIADKLTVKIDPNSQFQLGLVYNHYPIEPTAFTGGTPAVGGAGGFTTTHNLNMDWHFDDITVAPKYTRQDIILGRQSNTTISLVATTEISSGVNDFAGALDNSTQNYLTNLYSAASFTGSTDASLDIANDFEVAHDVWLTNSIDPTYTRRVVDNYYVNPAFINPFIGGWPTSRLDYHLFNAQGRVGLRWDATHDIQAYANVSRTVEAPTPDDMGFGGFGATGPALHNQTETTAEIGTRYKTGIFEGSVSLYHSWIRNQLLEVAIPGTSENTFSNASPTVAQGVEVGLKTTLWQDQNLPAKSPPHQLTFNQSYTYTDLHYVGDAIVGTNQLPGVPPSFYQAELLYEHDSGVYVGVNVEAASSDFVDYTNTFKANGYAILGAKVGYAPAGGRWDAYLQFKNLTDKHYASSVTPVYDAGGKDTPAFYPGDGFGVFAGFAFHF
jgi:iron complex outermembrane recepter protein